MNEWSPREAIAMERRHILDGKERIARQEKLVRELISAKRDRLAVEGNELLGIMRDILAFAESRLRELEARSGQQPKSN
jgi:hypothetical protein